jgi:hypothetical protein
LLDSVKIHWKKLPGTFYLFPSYVWVELVSIMADIGQVDGRIGKPLGLGRPKFFTTSSPIEVTQHSVCGIPQAPV